MSAKNDQNAPDNSGWNSWIPIIVLFCVGLWPVALFILARKLMGFDNAPAALYRMCQNLVSTIRSTIESDEKKSRQRRPSRHPYDIQQEQQRQAQQEQDGQQAQQEQQTYQSPYAKQHEQAAQRQKDTAWNQTSQQQNQAAWKQAAAGSDSQTVPPKGPEPKEKKSKKANKKAAAGQSKVKVPRGRALTFIGACVAGAFGLGFVSEFLDALAYQSWDHSWGLLWALRYEYSELAPLLGFFTAGLILFFYGISRTRKGKRFRKYLALIGRNTSISIDALAKATGKKRRRVWKDLQEMLDSGLLGAGYLDLSRDKLVLSDEGISNEEPAAQPAPEPEQPQDDYAVLLEIRQVNDAIPDPVMSEKIDRIGEITGKILDYQRQNPGKDSQLRSFLNYYLPTTLKILRAYAQLDAQGVEGENISAAKARIEGMMDKVVEGFEKQLDELFRDRAMDITSDVSVLERMLEKDGLSGPGQGLTLGG